MTDAEVDAATTWPPHWEADVTTADGGTVHVRPITPADADRLVAFHGRQSPESIYLRYFSARPTLSVAEVRHFTHVDLDDRVAFVALLGDELIGVGRYDRFRESDEAEVAFFIDDAHHGRGLATILLEYLAAAGRDKGVKAFVASVLPANRAMLSVFTGAGFDAVTRYADGVVEVRFDIAATPESMAALEDRAVRADARTVARLLEPRSVAVIGAGRRPGTLGHEVLRQLVAHRFAGPVYAVNREVPHVASVPAWPSVLDVPGPLDLAVVAVPADEVLDAVEECARARVGALVVASTGFAETGPEGLERARTLVALAHRHGIRVLGPASMGVINTAPEVRLHASFTMASPVPGRVALSLQSGTLGAGIIRQATARGIGFSSIASVGDKLDVSGNDLLAWWETDDRTDVIALSLASYGNPRRFRRLAPRVGRRKPIVALVRDPAGGAIELLAQMGVIGVATINELLDTTCLLAGQPVPSGPRVAVVADTLGSADFAAAACTAAGLEVVATKAVGADAAPHAFAAAVEGALAPADPAADALLAVYAAGVAARPDEVAEAIAGAAARAGERTTVVAAFPGHEMGGALPATGDRRIPDLGFPDAAAWALAAAVRHGVWLASPEGTTAPPAGVDAEAAQAAVAGWLADHDGGQLDAEAVLRVLEAAGATVVPQRLAGTASEAAAAAAALGCPVALKALGRSRTAKTEGAGVALDLQTPEDVAASWERMASAVGSAMHGGVVQAMLPPGTDLRVSLELAPVVGAALCVGAGGAIPGLPTPVARGVLPLSDTAAGDLLRRSGFAALLDGGGEAAATDLLLRVSWLAEEVPDVVRLELNPVIVTGGQAWVVGAEVEVAAGHDRPPDDLRRLAV